MRPFLKGLRNHGPCQLAPDDNGTHIFWHILLVRLLFTSSFSCSFIRHLVNYYGMGYSPVGVYAHGSTRHLRDGIHELVWSQRDDCRRTQYCEPQSRHIDISCLKCRSSKFGGTHSRSTFKLIAVFRPGTSLVMSQNTEHEVWLQDTGIVKVVWPN